MANREPSLARRVAPAVALTGVGFVIVNALDRPMPATGALPAGELAVDTSTPATVGGVLPTIVTTVPPVPNSVQAQGQTPTPVTQAPVVTQAPKATSAPKTTSAPKVTAAPQVAAPECGAVSKTGSESEITWRRSYGVITVSAKFTADGTLCDASAQWTTYDGRSQRYEDYAVPILNKQAESAHSANIQGVSGATAVSDAYRQSLQSALDQL